MKTCKACRNDFEPMRPMQRACSLLCAQAIAETKRHKEERAETKRRLLAIKPRSQWLKEAQIAFNAFIRTRDAAEPCVSCGRHHEGQWHAGHFHSIGARPELRFDEDNCQKQCQPCNTHLHGNLLRYRDELLVRIGGARFAALDANHAPKKYSTEELKLIRDTYRAKTRALLADHERIAA